MKKKLIDLILDFNMGPSQKARLILILQNKKPGAFIRMYPCNNSIDALKTLIKLLGLYCSEVSPAMDKSLYTLAVAKSQDIADRMKEAHTRDDHSVKGTLSGYPQSAVVAYTMGGGLRSWEYPKEMKDNPLGFRFSRVGIKKETELVEEWMNEIKTSAPSLFQEIYQSEEAPVGA